MATFNVTVSPVRKAHWKAPSIETAFGPEFFVEATDQMHQKKTAFGRYASWIHITP